MLVAEIEGKVAGMLFAEIYDFEDSPIATGYHQIEINELSVLPEYARLSIGSKLMQGAEKWAKDQGITNLSVLVYAFNEEAQSFYSSNGYKPYSIKMEKNIEMEKE